MNKSQEQARCSRNCLEDFKFKNAKINHLLALLHPLSLQRHRHLSWLPSLPSSSRENSVGGVPFSAAQTSISSLVDSRARLHFNAAVADNDWRNKLRATTYRSSAWLGPFLLWSYAEWIQTYLVALIDFGFRSWSSLSWSFKKDVCAWLSSWFFRPQLLSTLSLNATFSSLSRWAATVKLPISC